MQTLWLEDFVALAQTRSLSRAAELRHVTHPAFGRRIRALEAWAGTPLLERGGSPVRLTPAGEVFLETATRIVRELHDARSESQSVAGRQAQTVRLVTGRTLARQLVADWLVRLQPVLQQAEMRVSTGGLAETVLVVGGDSLLTGLSPDLALRSMTESRDQQSGPVKSCGVVYG